MILFPLRGRETKYLKLRSNIFAIASNQLAAQLLQLSAGRIGFDLQASHLQIKKKFFAPSASQR